MKQIISENKKVIINSNQNEKDVNSHNDIIKDNKNEMKEKAQNKFNEKKLKISPQIINYSTLVKKKITPLKINKINFSIKESPKKKIREQKLKNNLEDSNKNQSISSTIQKIQNEISNSKINNNNNNNNSQSTISKNTFNNNNFTNSNTIAPLTPSERFLLNEDFIMNNNNNKKINIDNEIMEPNFIPKNRNNKNFNQETNEIDDFIQFLKIKNLTRNTSLSQIFQIKENQLKNYQKNEENIKKKKINYHRRIKTQDSPFILDDNDINLDNSVNKIKMKINEIQNKVLEEKKNGKKNINNNIINMNNLNSILSSQNIINLKDKYQKSYKSIFDIKDDNSINSSEKNKLNLFGLDKIEDLNLSKLSKNKSSVNIKKDLNNDFYKENENNSYKVFQGFQDIIKEPNDKYLNKVKEDINQYKQNQKKKQEHKFKKINIPNPKNNLRSNTSNSFRKKNIYISNMGIMPANTLENVIDARANVLTKK